MNEIAMSELPLCAKIARLVQERGWNQEQFARYADLNRLTIRSILHDPERKLHNATVQACARALGVSVHDLQTLPLEKLLPKMRVPIASTEGLRLLYEQATQPELLEWMKDHPERASELTPLDMDELLSLQGTGGPLTAEGVEHYVTQIERRRKILEEAAVIAGTEYVDLLEQFVRVLYEKIQPYRERGASEKEVK
jgi:transcriptional regulator with XRE-family HTH domain